MCQHFLSLHELSSQEVFSLLDLADDVKARPGDYRDALAGRSLAMVFEKSSTRTRVSFEVGMHQLGGQGLFLSSQDLQLGRGETIADTSRVLSRYVDAIMLRTFEHEKLLEMARHSAVPVINGLTDDLHPCQALTDLLTLREEFGTLDGLKMAYIGDGNNMANSLLFGAAKVGLSLSVCTPKGYEVEERFLEQARQDAEETGARIETTYDPKVAAQGAHAVYTDVWASMGQENEREKRLRDFAALSVDSAVMAVADHSAIFLHCLPCHRGEEVEADVVDGPRSRVFDQAENRLHSQKAILLRLLEAA